MISWGTSWIRSSRCRCSTVEAMQPASSRAGITTVSLWSGGSVGSGSRRSVMALACRRCRASRDASIGVLRISSRMSSVVRVGAQSQALVGTATGRAPSRECRTGARPGPVPPDGRRSGCGTRRSACASDRAERTPPLTLTTRGMVAIAARDLLLDQRHEIRRVQAVPHLVTRDRRSRCTAAGACAASC